MYQPKVACIPAQRAGTDIAEHDAHTIHIACRAATPVCIGSDVAALRVARRYHLRLCMALPYAISVRAFQARLPLWAEMVTFSVMYHHPKRL